MNSICRKRTGTLLLAVLLMVVLVLPVSASAREDAVFLFAFLDRENPVVLSAAYVENPNGEPCVVTSASAGVFYENGEKGYLLSEKGQWEPELLEIRDDLAFFTVKGLDKQADPMKLGELREDGVTVLVGDWDLQKKCVKICREKLNLKDWNRKDHYLYCPDATVQKTNIVGAPVVSGDGKVIGSMSMTQDGKAAMVLVEKVEFPGKQETGGYLRWTPEKKQTDMEDGASYTGQLRDGKPQGQGTCTWKDGSRYEGNFENGHPSGTGTYFYLQKGKEQQIRRSDWLWVEEGYFLAMTCTWKQHPDKDTGFSLGDMETITRRVGEYVGMASGGENAGHGRVEFSNGSWYEGTFLDGEPDARGTYGSQAGRKGRTGDWEWVRHETAEFLPGFEGADTAYTGMTCDGKYSGFGVMGFENCGAFFGSFEDGEPCGSGEYVYREYNRSPSIQGDTWKVERDKKVYNSKFGTFTCHVLTLDGVMEGYGISINKKKQAYAGEFENHAYGGYGVFYGPNHEYWNYGKYAGGGVVRKDR